jgi:preprotein translocase subunit SecA
VGMHNFLTGDGSHGERSNRERLARWASIRFNTPFSAEQCAEMSSDALFAELSKASEKFLESRPDRSKISQQLDQLLNVGDDLTAPLSESKATEVISWAAQQLKVTIAPADLQYATLGKARAIVLHGFDRLYRPEMQQTERSVLLEILDTAWKDHLYFMGHLRQGIGFVGYAQKDPRTEYKREGRRAFNSMWDRVGEQVTQFIFRIEHESPNFVGSLWQITATAHDVAPPVETIEESYETSGGGEPEPGEAARAVEPIINYGPKVGRNDPCPCGSGKKYKKCCGS